MQTTLIRINPTAEIEGNDEQGWRVYNVRTALRATAGRYTTEKLARLAAEALHWAHEVDTRLWYDHDTKNWVGQVVDGEGNQIGEAEIAHDRRDVHLAIARRLRELTQLPR